MPTEIEEFEQGAAAANRRSPFACWLGGKWLLSRRIIPLIAGHHCYCEPFLGAGWVLFRKGRSAIEVANDINGDLINAWRVLAREPEQVTELLRRSLISRQIFEELRDMDREAILALTEAERAWRLLYILRLAFGGRDVLAVTSDEKGRAKRRPTFGIKKAGQRDTDLRRFEEIIAASWLRLCNVRFENMDWEKCVTSYDGPETFFYLDPPYMGCESYYGSGFHAEDYQRLAARLAKIRGRFILSLNDNDAARRLFGAFNLHTARVSYTLTKAGVTYREELLISNYDFDPEVMARHDVKPIHMDTKCE